MHTHNVLTEPCWPWWQFLKTADTVIQRSQLRVVLYEFLCIAGYNTVHKWCLNPNPDSTLMISPSCCPVWTFPQCLVQYSPQMMSQSPSWQHTNDPLCCHVWTSQHCWVQYSPQMMSHPDSTLMISPLCCPVWTFPQCLVQYSPQMMSQSPS